MLVPHGLNEPLTFGLDVIGTTGPALRIHAIHKGDLDFRETMIRSMYYLHMTKCVSVYTQSLVFHDRMLLMHTQILMIH